MLAIRPSWWGRLLVLKRCAWQHVTEMETRLRSWSSILPALHPPRHSHRPHIVPTEASVIMACEYRLSLFFRNFCKQKRSMSCHISLPGQPSKEPHIQRIPSFRRLSMLQDVDSKPYAIFSSRRTVQNYSSAAGCRTAPATADARPSITSPLPSIGLDILPLNPGISVVLAGDVVA